jgi:hypothetical protein
MNLDDLKRLAGMQTQKSNFGGGNGSNISITGTEKRKIEREKNIQPGTNEWFKLWFSLPYLTGEKVLESEEKTNNVKNLDVTEAPWNARNYADHDRKKYAARVEKNKSIANITEAVISEIVQENQRLANEKLKMNFNLSKHAKDGFRNQEGEAPLTKDMFNSAMTRFMDQYGKQIKRLSVDSEGVIKDKRTRLNIVFAIKDWESNDENQGYKKILVQTVMVKKDFTVRDQGIYSRTIVYQI